MRRKASRSSQKSPFYSHFRPKERKKKEKKKKKNVLQSKLAEIKRTKLLEFYGNGQHGNQKYMH